jgi:putative transposase
MRLHPQTYALTTVAHARKRVFQRTANAELLIGTIFRYREKGCFLVHAFVVMPDHLHLAITPEESTEKAVQLIKGGFSFAVRAQYSGEVWQPGYHAHRITNASDYCCQIKYIANNPMRKGLANYPHVHTTGLWPLDERPLSLS